MDGKPRKRNMRKRAAEQEDEGEQDPAAAIAAATAAAAKRSKAAKGGSTFATRRDEDDSKLRTFNFESSNALQQHSDMGATAVLETETQHDRDARALREQRMRQAAAAQAAQGVDAEGESLAQPPPDDGLYKGLNSYTDFRAGFRREQTVAGEKGKGHGPLRASVHMRQTAIFDYKPDICKDYKETGYCGYGDSCKFIHDRSDYKSGWELDREWEQEQKLKRQRELQKLDPDASGSDSDSEDDDGLPFACFICRRPWAEIKDPVVTRCKHYFCESCALKHNAKTSKCFVCEQPTGGIFNVATEIEKKVKLQKQQDISNR